MNINKEIEQYYEFIKGYRYIDESGRLDLDSFCVTLSHCFAHDKILDLSPQPRDMYNLLISMIREISSEDEFRLWVQVVPVLDWTSEMTSMYPDKTTTRIHIASLVHVMPHWIYDIGHTLIEIPRPKDDDRYFAWANPDWTFVNTFINGFHENYWRFLKDFDRDISSDRGASIFEAMHIAMSEANTSFDEATSRLNNRHTAQKEALNRIESAISAGYFLEAIALEESILSNCLFSFCKAKNKNFQDTSFYKLILEMQKHTKSDSEKFQMFLDIDKWRSNRNHIMHNFIKARSDELSKSLDTYKSQSEETAKAGLKLASDTCDWYQKEASYFVKTSWPTEDRACH